MPNLHDELKAVDNVEPPEQWDEIATRSPRHYESPRRHRLATVAVVFAIAGASFAFLISAFRGHGPASSEHPRSQAPSVSAVAGRAVVTVREGTPFANGLYSISLDSRAASRLRVDPAYYLFEPVISPDGSMIAVRGSNGEADAAIYMIDAAGRLVALTHSGVATAPSWSPDGSLVSFVDVVGSPFGNTTGSIMSVHADGSDVQAITDDMNLYRSDSYWESPAWSPDGAKLAFAVKEGGSYQIDIVNANGSGLRAITSGEGGYHCPSWSPDGQFLAFIGTRDLFAGTEVAGDTRRIASLSDPQQCPAWSPDGSIAIANRVSDTDIAILLVDSEGESTELARVRVPNGEATTNYGCPAWSADGTHVVYVAPDGLHLVGQDGQFDEKVSTDLPDGLVPSCPVSTGS